MANDRINGLIPSLSFCFLSGSIGGMLAGFVEVLLVARFGAAPAHFSGLLFAMIAYGLLGGALGKLAYLVLLPLPLHRERRESRDQLSAFIVSLTFAAIVFLIFVFRAFRDFHAEKVKPTQPLGLLTILFLLLAAAGLFFVLKFVISRTVLSHLILRLIRVKTYVPTVGVLLLAGLILRLSLGGETEEVRSPFADHGQARLQNKPCVILIMVDTLRPDHLACYGSGRFATPNIDALAADGILFRESYATSNNTKPSTASLLTSRYLSEHRAIHKTDLLPPGVTTLAEAFSQAGYYCGGIVTNVNLAPIYNFQQGFHEYVYLPPKFLFGANESSSRLVIYGVLRLIRMRLIKKIYPDQFYRPGEIVTNYFEDFLNRNGERKSFLFLHYMDPHDPYFEHPYNGRGYARAAMPNPDPRFVGPFERNYAQEIQYLDDWIGRVVSDLKKANLYNSSVILFTSDHGEEFYEHGGWWHGTTLHEEQIRVPLIVKLPDNADAGQISESPASIMDIGPTALRAAELEPVPDMRGRNLFETANSDTLIEVYAEADFEGNVGQMVRIGPWKYIQMDPANRRGRPAQQLFYLPDDPREQNNLAASQADKVLELAAVLKVRYNELQAARVSGSQMQMDRATQERLKALGYTQ
jgi:arylsulfatase A-like enzyme